MKQIEFKTEKGEFVACNFSAREENALNHSEVTADEIIIICKLSEATEQDAKGVVDGYNGHGYFNYLIKEKIRMLRITSAIESLHSLLTSKGIDINNGNWYLFKRV